MNASENERRAPTEEKKDETNATKTTKTTAKKEKPKSARGAPPRQNKEDFGDGFNVRGRGGGGEEEASVFVPPPPLKQHEQQLKEKQKKGAATPRVPRRASKKKNWWKELPEEKCDPITLEPFCEQTHAPFELLGKKFKREQSYSSLLNDDEEDNEDAEAAARMIQTIQATTTSEEQLQVKHLFDPESLAEYVVNAKTFENPLTREALDASDCQRLDEHLRKFSLKKFSVHRAYVNLQKEKKDELENAERRTEEQRARMQREREELRRTLASSMFTSIRERRQGENSSSGRNHHHQQQNGNSNSSNRNTTSNTTNMNNSNSEASAQQALAANLETSIEQQENAFRAFGAFAMVDDDIAMSRGQTLRAAQTSFSGWSNPEAIRRHGSNSNIPLSSAENFPSLGSGSGSSTTRIGTGGWSRMAQRASSLHDDDGGSVVRRPRVQPPPPTQTISSSSEPPANTHHEKQRERQREAEFAAAALPNDSVNADEARRAQLAAAFGISNPDSHVSAFAVSGAKSAFKQEHLKAAKNNPRLCAQIEQKFEEMARDANNRRATFPPMTKFLRGVVHEYAALWGFTSQSYGNEPNRRVDVFRTTACKKPTINLREAILAHDELKKEKEEKDRMMMMMSTTTTSDGVGGSSTPSMNQPPEDANEDEYFPGFTSYHTKRTGGVEYERLTATFSDGADKKTVFLMLRPWAGQFAVEVDEKESGDFDDAEYIAHFKNPEALKKASGVIGGGVKGKFKVKYSEKKGVGLLTGQSQFTDKANQTQSSSSFSNEFEKESISSVVSPPPKIFELRRKKKP